MAKNTNSMICFRDSCADDLEVADRSPSAYSCASFNSEEGFGSPMARRPKSKAQNKDEEDSKVQSVHSALPCAAAHAIPQILSR